MQLAPNKTSIKATITAVSNNGETLTVVIIKMPTKESLPAFLQIGKIVDAKNLSVSTPPELKMGDIISAEIEVMGDPFKQAYLLHDVVKVNDSI